MSQDQPDQLQSDYPNIRSFGSARLRLPRSASARQQRREARKNLWCPEPIPDRQSLRRFFPCTVDRIYLEIGFGHGEHTRQLIHDNPHIAMFACEPCPDLCARFLVDLPADIHQRLKVCDCDVRDLLSCLPPQSLDGAFLLFPDPWPKRRHHKRRLVNSDFLEQMARALTFGSVFSIATDDDDYASWIVRRALACPAFDVPFRAPDEVHSPWVGWSGTRYEAKARQAGREAQFYGLARL